MASQTTKCLRQGRSIGAHKLAVLNKKHPTATHTPRLLILRRRLAACGPLLLHLAQRCISAVSGTQAAQQAHLAHGLADQLLDPVLVRRLLDLLCVHRVLLDERVLDDAPRQLPVCARGASVGGRRAGRRAAGWRTRGRVLHRRCA